MPTKVQGGELSDEAAEVLRRLASNGPRSPIIDTAILRLGIERGITIHQHGGSFNNSFNNWIQLFNNSPIMLFLRAHFPNGLAHSMILRLLWALGGGALVLMASAILRTVF